ncbi:unnamed protein product [Rhodiola kirilowii]
MNLKLTEPYSESEVRCALFQMHPTKAPGLDGFSAMFYQKFWGVVREDLTKEVLRFLNEGILDNSLNETVIILVPKIKDASRVGDFRPISLCNVIMKIITKVLANRLKACLPEVISLSQSAFIKDRLISDNILIAHECSHFITHRKRGQAAYLSLKLDMSKAYNRVEWNFLEKMLLSLGFHDVWVSRVMYCVRSVSYRVKVNGKHSNLIVPKRGLRQGDPISPYLFILCQEWLSLKLYKEQESKRLEGIHLARGIPRINHLLFADDCLLFLKASFSSLRVLKEVLFLYESVSGQQVNYQKSEIAGSNNLDANMLCLYGEFLGMKTVAKHSKYLGLPLVMGRSKVEVFKWLEERMAKQVQDWKAILLSSAGKETLIKACLQAVPLYAMHCFKVPKTLCDKFLSLAMRFWWGSNLKDKGIHWVSRDCMLKEKEKGGLGFRCFEAMNIAMLMKQLWRFIKYPEQLVSRVYKARYFKDGLFVNARIRPQHSYAWNCLYGALEIFKSGLVEGTVADGWRWRLTNHGEFTVKSAYPLARNWLLTKSKDRGEPSNTDLLRKIWKRLWRTNLPDRIKIFTWRLYHDALPVAENLIRRGCDPDFGCCFCGSKQETSLHLFVECWWAKEFWRKLGSGEIVQSRAVHISDWMWYHMAENKLTDLKRVMVGAWVLWYNRNKQVHGKLGYSIDWCCSRTLNLILQFEKKALLGSGGNIGDLDQQDNVAIYCDGSWSSTSGMGGYAVVALYKDQVLCCSAKWQRNCSSVLEVEGLALLEGIAMAKRWGWASVCFFSDNTDALWALQTGQWNAIGNIQAVRNGFELLAKQPNWLLRFTFRENNIFQTVWQRRLGENAGHGRIQMQFQAV